MLPGLCIATEEAGAATLKNWCCRLSVLSFAVIFSSRVTKDSDCLSIAKTCSDITVNPRYYREVTTFQAKDNLMLSCTQCFVFCILQEVFYAECTTATLLHQDIFLFGFVTEQPPILSRALIISSPFLMSKCSHDLNSVSRYFYSKIRNNVLNKKRVFWGMRMEFNNKGVSARCCAQWLTFCFNTSSVFTAL